jgi:XTP/dITP diphosphohydrolase
VRVVLATSNEGKVREAKLVLAGTELEIVTVPLWLGEIETGTTYLENARLKAASAMRILGQAGWSGATPCDGVLAEDAGLEVDALGGLPGVRSARFAGPSAPPAANNHKLLALLDGVPEDRRTARFRAVAVLLLPTGREIVGEGVFEGRITDAPRGEGGFGYDPLFVPDGHTKTAAELPDDAKNEISHRGQALRAVAAAQ